MRRSSVRLHLLAACCVIATFAGPASAVWFATFRETAPDPSRGTAFFYDLVFFPGDVGGPPTERLDPTPNPNGDYLTIYDFVGFSGAAVQPNSSLVWRSQLVGPVAPATRPTDDPLIPNAVFDYVGPALTTQRTFSVALYSTGSTLRTGAFSAEITTHEPGNPAGDGQARGWIGQVQVSAVPEPGPGVVACALAALVALRRKRR